MAGVLFMVMPFCGAERPQIGVSTLKAQLLKEGIPCQIAYLNLIFADSVGYESYSWITHNYAYDVFAGEWIFARSLFSNEEIDYDGYVNEILVGEGAFTQEQIDRVMRMSSVVEPFLDHCMQSIEWDRYSIVGFTSTFEQNLASLSLAKRIKERFPDKIIVMGGGNCADEMGIQLHKSFPFLDYVFTGESDFNFLELVRRLGDGDPRREDIKGYVYREAGKSVATDAEPLAHNLDVLPYPNYDDYFEQFRASYISRDTAPCLQIETARGCWWGAKNHCTFCGLNRNEMTFRAKSPERALDEILHLVSRYDTKHISAVDNIISMHYFNNVLPELKRRNLDLKFFYETKANLKKDQINLLYDSGIRVIQPGVESFSDNVLKLMRKGVSPLQNAQLLKWCQLFGVEPKWNLLYGFPGENSKDYEEILDISQALTHLPPPEGYGSLRLDRFSPYFDYPDQFGIRNVRSYKPYRYLFPFEESELFNIAYFFDYDFDGFEKKERWFGPVRAELDLWKQAHAQSQLQVVSRAPDGMRVRDTRPRRVHGEYRFGRPETIVIDFCDKIQSLPQIQDHLSEEMNGTRPPDGWVRDFLNYMTRHRLMLCRDEKYLSLILPASARGNIDQSEAFMTSS